SDPRRGRARFGRLRMGDIESSGAMHLLPERLLTQLQPLETGPLAAALVSSALQSRRHIAPEEQKFFTMFFNVVANNRLSGEARSASVSPKGRPSTWPMLGDPAIDRVKGVLADLEYRVGSERLVEGVNDFLAMPGAGTGKELLDAIARRSGVPLDHMYRDFFVGSALPRVTLVDVASRRAGAAWIVTGSIRNVGTGEILCPLVLRTRTGALRRIVRIDGGETIPFTLTAESEPRTLQLDPDHICYRQPATALSDSVELKEAL
ncbi:MAG TPA: hypothetical protein VJZ00_25330, partial [Thermoanaerobaculia bacterium]|nr:hypothetical protein [Thermoanaerobaculia bacterium]